MKITTPKAIAWSASVTAVGLAGVPAFVTGQYDPATAVLTATLVGVIWYTYFAFQAVHHPSPALIRLGLKADIFENNLRPRLTNLGNRTAVARLALRAWGDEGFEFDPDNLYDGGPRSEVLVGPGEDLEVQVSITPIVTRRTANEVHSFLPSQVLLVMQATWKDEYGSKGATPYTFWFVESKDARTAGVFRITTRAQIEKLFADLEWQGKPALEGIL